MRSFLTLTVVCLTALLWIPQSVHAFSISPSVVELNGSRSDIVQSTITVINTSAADQTFYLGTMKFVPREESGKPQFIPPEEDLSGFPEWISFEQQSVKVSGGSKVDVPFTIAIPDGADSGTHHAAIVISDSPYEVVEANGVSLNARIAVLLFLTVEGETLEAASLLDFTSSIDGKTLSVASGDFAYRLQNQGNVNVTPVGTVTVRDIFGRQIEVVDANAVGGRLLPESTRKYDGVFGPQGPKNFFAIAGDQFNQFVLGPVTIDLSLEYGQSGLQITDSISFWVIPWQLLVLVFVSLSLLLAAIKVFKKKQ